MAGIAQPVLTIGVNTLSAPVLEPTLPLHEAKGALRDTHKRLVGRLAKQYGLDHRVINQELHKRTGGWIDTATMTQLKKRNAQLESWIAKVYDGGRK